MFRKLCIIGVGMIGGSVALAARNVGVQHIVGIDTNADNIAWANARGMIDNDSGDDLSVLHDSDLVMVAVPVRSYVTVFDKIMPYLKMDAVVSDVGSTKRGVMSAAQKYLPERLFVGGHPIAGLEKHGPSHADATLFQNRWTILCPPADVPASATDKLSEFWRACGSHIEIMDAAHHDRVLAITSHLPQLIARTIVGTAADLENEIQDEVIKFSAGGFRDFTRMAAADPVMWRDIFLENGDAVLEMLQRLSEDIAVMQKTIRMGDGDQLEKIFTRARDIRSRVIEAKQA